MADTFEPDDVLLLTTGVAAFCMTLQDSLLGRCIYSGFQPLSHDRETHGETSYHT